MIFWSRFYAQTPNQLIEIGVYKLSMQLTMSSTLSTFLRLKIVNIILHMTRERILKIHFFTYNPTNTWIGEACHHSKPLPHKNTHQTSNQLHSNTWGIWNNLKGSKCKLSYRQQPQTSKVSIKTLTNIMSKIPKLGLEDWPSQYPPPTKANMAQHLSINKIDFNLHPSPLRVAIWASFIAWGLCSQAFEVVEPIGKGWQ